MFRGEITPDEVWECIMTFPRDSATWSAVLADPETVFSGDEDAEPPWADWGPEAQRLDDVYDVLAVISDQIAKFGSGSPVKVTPRRRPGDARREQLKRERSAQARAEWGEMLRQMGIPE